MQYLQYMRDCIIDVNKDSKETEEEAPNIPHMQTLDGIDYNEVDRNIEALTYGETQLAQIAQIAQLADTPLHSLKPQKIVTY